MPQAEMASGRTNRELVDRLHLRKIGPESNLDHDLEEQQAVKMRSANSTILKPDCFNILSKCELMLDEEKGGSEHYQAISHDCLSMS